MCSKIGQRFARNLVEPGICKGPVALNGSQAYPIPVEPGLGRRFLERGFRPRLETVFDELFESRRDFFVSQPNFSLCQRCAVCGFHLPSHLVIALLSGLPDELALPHELVPIDAAGAPLAALLALPLGIELTFPALVDH